MNKPRPYTPEMVAERWGCTANHVRNLIKAGKLPAFRLGDRLLRVPASAVEEFEQCENTKSESSTGDGSSGGGKTESGGAFVLKLAPSAMRSEKR